MKLGKNLYIKLDKSNIYNSFLFLCLFVVFYVVMNYVYHLLDAHVFYVKPSQSVYTHGPHMLLFSNTKMCENDAYLGHGKIALESFVRQYRLKSILHMPYANPDIKGGYNTKDAQRIHYEEVKPMYQELGVHADLLNMHESVQHQIQAIHDAEAIFMSGGNSFICLRGLHQEGVMKAIHHKIVSGTPFIGSSAGSLMTSPTIDTTNDMPICCLENHNALNIIPFQMNLHYDESHNTKLKIYLKENRTSENGRANWVLGLREGSVLHVCGDSIELCGLKSKPATKIYLDEYDDVVVKHVAPGNKIDE